MVSQCDSNVSKKNRLASDNASATNLSVHTVEDQAFDGYMLF